MLASKHVRFWCQYQTRTLVLRYPCIPEAMAVANDDEWDDETYARQQEGNGSGKSRRTKGDRKVCCTGSQGLSKNIHEYTVIFAEKLKQMFVLKALQLCKTDSMKHMGQTNGPILQHEHHTAFSHCLDQVWSQQCQIQVPLISLSWRLYLQPGAFGELLWRSVSGTGKVWWGKGTGR